MSRIGQYYRYGGTLRLMHTSRDIMVLNVMNDGSELYPNFHPVRHMRTPDMKHHLGYRSRTVYPPTYYVIDFGISCNYRPEDGPPLEVPIIGGHKSAPEHQTDRMNLAILSPPTYTTSESRP